MLKIFLGVTICTSFFEDTHYPLKARIIQSSAARLTPHWENGMVRWFYAGLATAMLVGCSSTSPDPERESKSNAQLADEQVALQEEVNPKTPIIEEQPATKHPLVEAARVLAKPTLATPIEAEGGVESLVGPAIDPNHDPFVYYSVPVELNLDITSKGYIHGDRTIVVKQQAKRSTLVEYAKTASEVAKQQAGMIHVQMNYVDVDILIPWHRAKRITTDGGISIVTLVDGGKYTGKVEEVVKDQDGSRYFIGACDTVTVTTAFRTSAPDNLAAPSCQFSVKYFSIHGRTTDSFTGRNAQFFSGNTDRPPSFADCGTNYSLKVGDKTVKGSLADVQKMTVIFDPTISEEGYGTTTLVLRSGEKLQGTLVVPPEVEGSWGLVFQTDDECVVIVKSMRPR
jgi:hypothetical protein